MNIKNLYSECYDLVDDHKPLDVLHDINTEDLARLWQFAEAKRLESEEEMFATGNDDYYIDAQISERIQDEVEEVLGSRDVEIGEKGSFLESILGSMVPRRTNPSTSLLGALVIGGIIGHSMKNK